MIDDLLDVKAYCASCQTLLTKLHWIQSKRILKGLPVYCSHRCAALRGRRILTDEELDAKWEAKTAEWDNSAEGTEWARRDEQEHLELVTGLEAIGVVAITPGDIWHLTDPGTGFLAFWAHVNQFAGKDACWVWTGNLPNGYGVWGGMHAHRWMWTRILGRDATDMDVHHRCQNKKCVRPDHLIALTPKEHSEAHMALRQHQAAAQLAESSLNGRSSK